jgi:hypothetical protein
VLRSYDWRALQRAIRPNRTVASAARGSRISLADGALHSLAELGERKRLPQENAGGESLALFRIKAHTGGDHQSWSMREALAEGFVEVQPTLLG